MHTSENNPVWKKPVVLYVTTGLTYTMYTIWSARSLQRFGYDSIEIVVGKKHEKLLVNAKLPNVHCEVVPVSRQKYHIWMWKVFVLDQYRLKHTDRDVVISDGDILWHEDPTSLFQRFAGQFWFHKLHYYDNPAELERLVSEIPPDKSNWLDLACFSYYWERYGFLKPQPYMLSGGLFMVPAAHYQHLVARWATAGRGLPPSQARRNQVLLSIVANEMGLEPVRDREAGYAVAKHYLSNMKDQLVSDAEEFNLDPDGLARFVRLNHMVTKTPKSIYRKIRSRF